MNSAPWLPSVSSEYLTSAEVIGLPSDHSALGSRWKVTVFLSGDTSQLFAMPGTGEKSLGLKLTSRSQLIAQAVKSSSSRPTNGLSVCGSCAQPIFSTLSACLESWAPTGEATATASTTVAASSPVIVHALLNLIRYSLSGC